MDTSNKRNLRNIPRSKKRTKTEASSLEDTVAEVIRKNNLEQGITDLSNALLNTELDPLTTLQKLDELIDAYTINKLPNTFLQLWSATVQKCTTHTEQFNILCETKNTFSVFSSFYSTYKNRTDQTYQGFDTLAGTISGLSIIEWRKLLKNKKDSLSILVKNNSSDLEWLVTHNSINALSESIFSNCLEKDDNFLETIIRLLNMTSINENLYAKITTFSTRITTEHWFQALSNNADTLLEEIYRLHQRRPLTVFEKNEPKYQGKTHKDGIAANNKLKDSFVTHLQNFSESQWVQLLTPALDSISAKHRVGILSPSIEIFLYFKIDKCIAKHIPNLGSEDLKKIGLFMIDSKDEHFHPIQQLLSNLCTQDKYEVLESLQANTNKSEQIVNIAANNTDPAVGAST